jgi:Ca-activated chloride channel family protein
VTRHPDVTILALAAGLVLGCGNPKPSAVALVADPNLVQFDGAVSNTHVLADAPDELLVRLRISSAELSAAERPPINLALVIDTSGSMKGDAIAAARTAAAEVVSALRDGDRLAVIAFGSEAEVVIESSELSNLERAAVLGRIGEMQARGTTGMTAGLQAGLSELGKHRKPDRINRMVLLSDGIPNQPASVEAMIAQAKQMTIPVTALGFGIDYDESLLARAAQTTGGSFHYVEEPEQVAAVFVKEVARMTRVIAQNMSVRLTPGPGLTIVDVFGAEVGRQGPAASVNLGDISQGESRELIVKLTSAGRRDGANVELLDAALSFDDAIAGAGRLERKLFLEATSTGDRDALQQGADQSVELSAARAEAASATVTAVALARSGQLEQAQTLLETAREAATEALNRFDEDPELTELIAAMAELAEALPSFVTQVAPQPVTDIQFEDDSISADAAEAEAPAASSYPAAKSTINRSHQRAMKTLQGR